MRRTVISGLLIGCVLIALAMIIPAIQTPLTDSLLAKTAVATSVQNGDRLDHTGPSQDFHEGVLIRAVLNSPSFHYLVRRMLPAWGKVFIVKRVINTSFFFPIMVLLLFFIFYQSSRTASEGDPPIKYDGSFGSLYPEISFSGLTNDIFMISQNNLW